MANKRHLTLRLSVAALVVAAALAVGAASASAHGPALLPGCARQDTSRGSIPKSYGIQACFDGDTVTLRNDLHFPVTVTPTGSATAGGGLGYLKLNQTLAAFLVRTIDSHAGLVLPGDIVQTSVGKGAGEVRISGAHSMQAYAIADAASDFIPVPWDAYKAFSAMSKMVLEASDAMNRFVNCMDAHRRSAVKRAVCKAVYHRDIVFAIGRALFNGFPKKALATKVLAAILGPWTFAQSVSNQVHDLSFVLLHASGRFRIAAVPPPDLGGNPGGDPGGNPGGNPGGGPGAQGPSITATKGGRYGCSNCSTLDVAVHNFPTGVYTYVCHDNSGPSGSDSAFFSHAVAITDPNQSVWPGVFCWDNAPYTAYVVINSVTSNSVYFRG